MIKSTKAKIALVGALALALVGASATAANADTPAGSSGPYWILNGDTGVVAPAGSSFAWDAAAIASPVSDNIDAVFTGSADSTGVRVFLSPQGQERNIGNWSAWAPSGFVPGTTDVLLPNASPAALINGIPGANAVKASGGAFSLGIAFTKNNGVTIADAGVFFTHVNITAGTGVWTFDTPTGPVVTPHCELVPLPADCLTADIDLEATTIAAADGALTLSVPAAAKATFGAATLVNQLSTSTATLPEVTVSDARVVTRPGWTLTHSVANFVSGANTIEAKYLGVAPKLVAAGTTSTNAVAGAAQVAGSAVFPAGFAEAPAGPASLGDTKLSADLKLVAPADAPAGTYTSKMTLTLVSK